MDTKFIAGSLTAAIAAFLGGWLLWGMVLHGYYEANTNQCMANGMEDMVWWSLIAFNLVWGVFIATILTWAGSTTFIDGFIKGVIIGFLITLTYDLQFYSFTSMFSGKMIVIVDVIAGAAFTGIIAGLTALVMSKVS